MLTSKLVAEEFSLILQSRQFQPADSVNDAVNAIWAASCERNVELFDGTIVALVESRPGVLLCYKVPYRYFFACLKDRSIQEKLNLTAIAVSGALIVEGAVVLGRRSNKVSQFPGFYELVPSGSLTVPSDMVEGAVDYEKQLLIELEEEIGISSEQVLSINPFLLVEDRQSCTTDICCRIYISTEITIDRVIDNFKPAEYVDLQFVQPNAVDAFLRRSDIQLVPASHQLLQRSLESNCW